MKKMGYLIQFTGVNMWKKKHLIVLLCMLFFPLITRGQLPDLPEWIEDTVFIDPDYIGDESGTIQEPFNSFNDLVQQENTAYLFKRRTTLMHDGRIEWKKRGIYVGAYGMGAKPVIRPKTSNRSMRFFGEYSFIQNIEVFPQDTSSSRGVEFTLDKRSIAFADSLIVHGCFIGFGGWNCQRLEVSNLEIYDIKHDGMYFDNCDSTIFTGCHVWNINTDWAWRPDIAYSGGDCIQTENVDYVYVDNCILDHSYWGGKFALITNGNDTTICKNSIFKSAEGTSALYISKTFMDGCEVIGGDKGVWNIGGNRFFVHNTIFRDCDIAIYGTASEVYNCTFVDISDVACHGWILGWDVRNSIFYNVKQVFASTENLTCNNNIYYNSSGDQPKNQFGEGNLTSNPLFVDQANKNFQLQPGSPAIDAGTIIPKVSHDYNGFPRVAGSSCDIGVHEFHTGVQPPPVKQENNPPVMAYTADPEVHAYVHNYIDASECYDEDNDVLTYTWTIPEDMVAKDLHSPVLEFLILNMDDVQDYEIELSISDGKEEISNKIKFKAIPYNPNKELLNVSGITASSYQEPNLPKNLIDNYIDTRWSAEGYGQWVQFEMENEAHLSHILLRFLNSDSRCSYFQILASKDEQIWDTLISKEASCGFVDNYQLFKIPSDYTSEKYKYVKYVGMMNSENDWNSVNEIIFYGSLENLTSIDREKDVSLVLYPNPVRTNLNIEFDNTRLFDYGACNITILNYLGQVIRSKSISSSMDFPVTIPVDDLKKGMYILHLEMDNREKNLTKKFLIE